MMPHVTSELPHDRRRCERVAGPSRGSEPPGQIVLPLPHHHLPPEPSQEPACAQSWGHWSLEVSEMNLDLANVRGDFVVKYCQTRELTGNHHL